MVASQEEAAQKLEESEKRLTDLEAENEELFGKATAAEEEVDAATGKLFAANNDLDAARQHWEEAERRVQELRESRQHEASKVCFLPVIIIFMSSNMGLPCMSYMIPLCGFSAPLNSRNAVLRV